MVDSTFPFYCFTPTDCFSRALGAALRSLVDLRNQNLLLIVCNLGFDRSVYA